MNIIGVMAERNMLMIRGALVYYRSVVKFHQGCNSSVNWRGGGVYSYIHVFLYMSLYDMVLNHDL